MKKPAEVVAIDDAKRLQKVDRFGELRRQEALFAPVAAELKQLRDEIASWFDTWPPDQPAVAVGVGYVAQLSPCENETVIDIPRLFKLAGRAIFLGLCRFPVTAFDQLNLDPKVKKSLVVKARTGPRTVKAVAKTPIQTAPEAA